jgi:hypothetical protein
VGGECFRPERRSRASYTETDAGEGREDMGGGVVERGLADRLAEVASATGLRSLAEALGGRAHLLVALAEQEDEQGLRTIVCHRRSVHLRGDESLDGAALGSLMKLFGQFHKGRSRKLRRVKGREPSIPSA